MKTLCVHWPRFGPYHMARLRASHVYLDGRGIELVGLETAGTDAVYAWEMQTSAEPFRRHVAFPDRTFDEIPPAEMEEGVRKALDRISPDAIAITSYSYPDARAALRWAREHRRIAILMTDSKEDDAARSWWRERLKMLLVSQYDSAFVGGHPQVRYARQLGVPADVIFTGADAVDNAFFSEAAKNRRASPGAVVSLPGVTVERPYFLAVNRLLPLKNLDGLILAYRDYRRAAEEPWDLVLVGDGPDRGRLEARIAGESIDGVSICGFRQSGDLARFYAHAGAFVHPTHKDTWGLVVNEAMAAGLPVLVSERAGCVEDLVEDGVNGYAFDPADRGQITALLLRMAGPEVDRRAMGLRSQQIVERFSLAQYSQQLLRAAEAGRRRSARGLHPAARTLLWLLRTLARDPSAFQSNPDTSYVQTTHATN